MIEEHLLADAFFRNCLQLALFCQPISREVNGERSTLIKLQPIPLLEKQLQPVG